MAKQFPGVTVALLLVAAVGCTNEAPIGPDGPIDFQGTWIGNIGDPNLVNRVAVRWTPTHSRSTVTGAIVFQLTPALSATGTLTGTVDEGFIHFNLVVPAGAYPSPVSPSCTLTGSGDTSDFDEIRIVSLLTLIYTAPCLGTVTSVTNTVHRITLTKDGGP